MNIKLATREIRLDRLVPVSYTHLDVYKRQYLLYVYEQIAGALLSVLKDKQRFNDYEKAQMFIGYLAALPKKEKVN